VGNGKKHYAIKRAVTDLGLFTTEDIPAGKCIIEYVGHLISTEEVEKRLGRYFFGVNTKWSINGRARSNAARYPNHWCRPNAEAFILGHRIWIWSKKEISPQQASMRD
jgi:uncharacterized protein